MTPMSTSVFTLTSQTRRRGLGLDVVPVTNNCPGPSQSEGVSWRIASHSTNLSF
uniref:Uncharacterized protein n=1 Tax=Lepeophtheirus salmonis TaxID=72036 RepID=A0A0K2UI79_LEPSM